MHKSTPVLVGILFFLIVGGMFGYAYLKRTETVIEVKQDAQSDAQSQTAFEQKDVLTLVDHYEGITHTITGELMLPTPCYDVATELTVAESYPEQVIIDIKTSNNGETMCAQVITPKEFTVTLDASPDARFSARINSREVDVEVVTQTATTTES